MTRIALLFIVLILATSPIARAQQNRPPANAESFADWLDKRWQEAQKQAAAYTAKGWNETRGPINCRTPQELLPILASYGDLPGVIYCIEKKHYPVNYQDRHGCTAIDHAVGTEENVDPQTRLAIVAYLLRQPTIDVNLADDMGNNAFVYAWHWLPDALPMLIRAGATWPKFQSGYSTVLTVDQVPTYPLELFRNLLENNLSPGFYPTMPKPDGSSFNDFMESRNLSISTVMQDAEPALCNALVSIANYADSNSSRNEPESYSVMRSKQDFRKGFTLLLNRLIGNNSKCISIYRKTAYRNANLPEQIRRQIAVIRSGEESTPAEKKAKSHALIRNYRILNMMFLEFYLQAGLPSIRGLIRQEMTELGRADDYNPPPYGKPGGDTYWDEWIKANTPEILRRSLQRTP